MIIIKNLENRGSKMNYQEMLKEARQNLNGSCKVCKACNGVACSGEVPGMGGKGTGSAFTENFKI